MNLSDFSKQNLNETRKWTFYLSILGFVFIGLMIIGSLSIGAIFNQLGEDNLPFPSSMFGGIYFVVGAIYFFPIYYLFKFSTHMKNALLSGEEMSLDEAFKNLKSHYKFMGVFTIVILSIYILAGLAFALIGFSL